MFTQNKRIDNLFTNETLYQISTQNSFVRVSVHYQQQW